MRACVRLCVRAHACDISLDISWSKQDNRTAPLPDVSDGKPAAIVQRGTSRLQSPKGTNLPSHCCMCSVSAKSQEGSVLMIHDEPENKNNNYCTSKSVSQKLIPHRLASPIKTNQHHINNLRTENTVQKSSSRASGHSGPLWDTLIGPQRT